MKWKKIKNKIPKISALICIIAISCNPTAVFAIEPQTIEPQTIEPQTIEPQTIEPQPTEPQTIEPQFHFNNGFIESGSPWYFLDGKYYYIRSDGSLAAGSLKEGETVYTFAPETGSLAYAKRVKNSGGGSFNIGFYKKECQELADNLNELKEEYFDGDEDDDYYEDDKKDYDKDASFMISGRLTEIAEHRLAMARSKGYGDGRIPDEGTLSDYLKSVDYNSGRRSMEVYLKNCDGADEAENKLLRSHSADEKKSRDRAVYYSEMGIAHENVNGKDYYMIIFMR